MASFNQPPGSWGADPGGSSRGGPRPSDEARRHRRELRRPSLWRRLVRALTGGRRDQPPADR